VGVAKAGKPCTLRNEIESIRRMAIVRPDGLCDAFIPVALLMAPPSGGDLRGHGPQRVRNCVTHFQHPAGVCGEPWLARTPRGCTGHTPTMRLLALCTTALVVWRRAAGVLRLVDRAVNNI